MCLFSVEHNNTGIKVIVLLRRGISKFMKMDVMFHDV